MGSLRTRRTDVRVIAKYKFRADNQWVDGGHNRTTLKNFYGIQQDHEHKEAFLLDADEPPCY